MSSDPFVSVAFNAELGEAGEATPDPAFGDLSVSGKINDPPPSGKIGEPAIGTASLAPRAILTELLDDDIDSTWKLLALWKQFKQRQWFKTLRSPIEFCSTKNFKRPESKETVVQRLQVNSKYFMTNYIILSSIVFVYCILSQPLLLLCLGVFAWMWLYATNHEEIKFAGGRIAVSGRMKFGLLTALTAFVVVYMAGSTIMFVFGLCSVAIFMHALFHSSVNPEDLEDFELLPTQMP